jgi:carboxyl-terminal processing protease
MNKKILTIGGIIGALILLAGTFSAGLVMGRFFQAPPDIPTQILSQEENITPQQEETEGEEGTQETETEAEQPEPTQEFESVEELFAPFWEAWDIVHEQYVDQPLDDVALMRGAIEGMLDAIGDQHTSYMDPDEYMQATIPMEGEYEGIGAWVDTNAEYLTIVSPMPGSPAEEAGLQPGDQIIAIDGEDMTGLDGNAVIKKVLGPAGTDVVLTIRREGEPEPFDVTVTREKITIPSIDYRILEEQDNIGYIQIITFGEDTGSELREAISALKKENPDGLIIDLRNNGGGYLQVAVEVTSEFISEGAVLYEDYGGDEELKVFEAQNGGLATDLPLVVLVNEGTASASEIVAGALQDYERAPLVGQTTFGKGSVQVWTPLSNDQGAVRVTIARWLTPDKRQIHEKGLEPDYLVEYTEEDYQEERTPQLDKAIEVLLNEIKQ